MEGEDRAGEGRAGEGMAGEDRALEEGAVERDVERAGEGGAGAVRWPDLVRLLSVEVRGAKMGGRVFLRENRPELREGPELELEEEEAGDSTILSLAVRASSTGRSWPPCTSSASLSRSAEDALPARTPASPSFTGSRSLERARRLANFNMLLSLGPALLPLYMDAIDHDDVLFTVSAPMSACCLRGSLRCTGGPVLPQVRATGRSAALVGELGPRNLTDWGHCYCCRGATAMTIFGATATLL